MGSSQRYHWPDTSRDHRLLPTPQQRTVLPTGHSLVEIRGKLVGINPRKRFFLFLTHFNEASPTFLPFQKTSNRYLLPNITTTHLSPSLHPPTHLTYTTATNYMTIRQTTRSLSPEPIMPKPTTSRTPKPPSPVNVSHFPTEGWVSHTRPTKCVVPGLIGIIIGSEDYYDTDEHVLCTRAFSTAAIATTVDDGASPHGSTELDDETGHNCKMLREIYSSFARLVLGLNQNTWALHHTESAFRNLLI